MSARARHVQRLNIAAIFMAGFVAATILFVVTGLLSPTAAPVDPTLPPAATTQVDADEVRPCAQAYDGLVMRSTDDEHPPV
jgi:hypothetical protein